LRCGVASGKGEGGGGFVDSSLESGGGFIGGRERREGGEVEGGKIGELNPEVGGGEGDADEELSDLNCKRRESTAAVREKAKKDKRRVIDFLRNCGNGIFKVANR
jgi:hypothetical protein